MREQQLILDLANPEGCRAEFYRESLFSVNVPLILAGKLVLYTVSKAA